MGLDTSGYDLADVTNDMTGQQGKAQNGLGGVEWRLCRVREDSPPSATQSLLGAWDDLAERERDLGIAPGQPFLLPPGGWPDRDVLAFFNSASFRRLALQTQIAYATDLKVHFTFLASQGLDWRDATVDNFLRTMSSGGGGTRAILDESAERSFRANWRRAGGSMSGRSAVT